MSAGITAEQVAGRPYLTHSFMIGDDIDLSVTVEHPGDPVKVEMAGVTLMLPPALAIAVGKAIEVAGKSSLAGKRRQVARAEAQKAEQDAEGTA